ncbi:oligopeptide/dipeptide ABC transporter ATP-binding protein [Escherichia coli]|nr:ABC transporter ATP-binding protein [Escherichia coli]
MSDTLLTLRDVHINFPARKNWLGKTTEHVHAINGIDLQIRRGETLGIVGESGCGKSTLAQLLMGMLQPSHGQYIRSGSQRIMQMVFQDPLSSLNPRLPVWRIITEPLWIRHMSDRVAVMYLGQIVELGEAQQVLTAPAHPYTRLLLDSLPAIDKPLEEEWALRKTDLPGNRTLPQGCFFYERCPLATHGCEVRQSLTIREDGREIRCWRAL